MTWLLSPFWGWTIPPDCRPILPGQDIWYQWLKANTALTCIDYPLFRPKLHSLSLLRTGPCLIWAPFQHYINLSNQYQAPPELAVYQIWFPCQQRSGKTLTSYTACQRTLGLSLIMDASFPRWFVFLWRVQLCPRRVIFTGVVNRRMWPSGSWISQPVFSVSYDCLLFGIQGISSCAISTLAFLHCCSW